MSFEYATEPEEREKRVRASRTFVGEPNPLDRTGTFESEASHVQSLAVIEPGYSRVVLTLGVLSIEVFEAEYAHYCDQLLLRL